MRLVLTFLVASVLVLGCSFSDRPDAASGDEPKGFATAQPDLDRFAETIAALMLSAGAGRAPADWGATDAARWIRWQAPPAKTFQALLAGGDFTRKGTASFGGRSFEVIATGSREALLEVRFRNDGAPIGEDVAIAALQAADFIVALARCALPASPMARDNWWHIVGPGKRPAFFHADKVCDGASCERFDLILADSLPPLTASERVRYTDHCTDDASAGPIASVPQDR